MFKLEEKGTDLQVYLSGEIDHHTARDMRFGIDEAVGRLRPAVLLMDFRAVTFMDSSGIGLVMGRYKLMHSMTGSLKVINLPVHIKKVMTLAGLDKLAVIE